MVLTHCVMEGTIKSLGSVWIDCDTILKFREVVFIIGKGYEKRHS